jgi:phosphoadenosine phosphosulfate reductase
LTPVFAEELTFLREHAGADWIPEGFGDFVLWANNRDYYLDGSRVASLSFQGAAPSVKLHRADLSFEAKTDADDFLARFSAANGTLLRSLEAEALSFIRTVAADHNGRVPVVPFSGGKDSLVVSRLVRKALPSDKVLHVFGDTGIESSDTHAFIEQFGRANPTVPLLRSVPNVDFFDMCEVLGPPSRIKRWCCSTQKAFPLSVVYSALGPVLTFCGVRRAESVARTGHERLLHDTKIADEMMACPVIEWDDFHIWSYLILEGMPFNRGYARGFRRIGCLHCPFNSRRSEVLKKHYYPLDNQRWEHLVAEYYAARSPKLPDDEIDGRWKVRAGGIRAADDLAQLEVSACDADSRAINVQLKRDSDIPLAQLLVPFGMVLVTHDDGILCNALVLSPKNELLFEIRQSRPRHHYRITFHGSGRRLMEQRVLRQLRKLSACVRCGACQMVCPTGALTVGEQYSIDHSLCTQCQRCVRRIGRGCVAAHATNASGDHRWA